MFKSIRQDNARTNVFIQGAYSQNSNTEIAALVFQNYDNDTKKVYNMAEIALIDNFGDTNSNGIGDLILGTNEDGSSNIPERVRIKYDGNVGIATRNPQYTLDVNGDINYEGTLYRRGIPFTNTVNLDKVSALSTSWNNSLYILWDNVNSNTSNLNNVIIETTQDLVADQGKGTRVQRLSIDTFNLNLDTITTQGYGNVSIFQNIHTDVIFSSNNVKLTSYTTDHTLSNLSHNFQIEVLMIPEHSVIGKVYFGLSNSVRYSYGDSLDFFAASNALYSLANNNSDMWKISDNLVYLDGSNMALRNINSQVVFYSSNNFIGLNDPNPESFLSVNGDISARNLLKKTKRSSNSNVDMTIMWDRFYENDNLQNVVIDITQQLCDNAYQGVRSQTIGIGLPNKGITWKGIAIGNGSSDLYSLLNVYVTNISSNSITLRSDAPYISYLGFTHSFTVNIVQTPDDSITGKVWIT